MNRIKHVSTVMREVSESEFNNRVRLNLANFALNQQIIGYVKTFGNHDFHERKITVEFPKYLHLRSTTILTDIIVYVQDYMQESRINKENILFNQNSSLYFRILGRPEDLTSNSLTIEEKKVILRKLMERAINWYNKSVR